MILVFLALKGEILVLGLYSTALLALCRQVCRRVLQREPGHLDVNSPRLGFLQVDPSIDDAVLHDGVQLEGGLPQEVVLTALVFVHHLEVDALRTKKDRCLTDKVPLGIDRVGDGRGAELTIPHDDVHVGVTLAEACSHQADN